VNEGRLFLMEDGILFVGSPVTFVSRFSAENVNVIRSNSRTFEVHIKVPVNHSGEAKKKSKDDAVEFSMMSVDELPGFENYLSRTKFGKAQKPSASLQKKVDQAGETTSVADDESLSSDDSPYSSEESTSSASDSEEEEAETKANGADSSLIVLDESDEVEVVEGREASNHGEGEEDSDEDDDDESSSSDSCGSQDAELVEEDKFEPDPDDVITDRKKRRRRV